MPGTSGNDRRSPGALALATFVVVALGMLAVSAGPVQAQDAGPARSKAGAATRKAVVRTGTVRILHEDDFANKRTKHRVVLQADGKDFRLDGVAAASAPKAGSTVRVSGAEVGATIEVSGLTTLAPPPAAAMAATVGPRETAIVLVNFSDNQARPFTAADALTRVFTGPDSANAYYKESSNGALSLVGRASAAGDVFGWYTIPQYSSPCDQASWASSARQAARAAGQDLTAYDNVVYVFPTTTSCQWGGLAYIGNGPYGMGEAWINGSLETGIVSHELGHNFGMHHASSLSCGTPGQRTTITDIYSCVADEYGDPFDVMGDPWSLQRGGTRYGRQPHSWHQEQAGMLPASAVTTVTRTGDYTLTAAESETGTRSLRVALPWFSPYYYYLELRTPEGRFDDFPATAPVVQGVSIRLSQGPESITNSYLLDTTPATTTFQDAALAVGREFYDPLYGRVAVKVKSISGGVAVVNIEVDAVGASVVSVAPSANAVVPRTSNVVVTFSAPMNRTSVQDAFALGSQGSEAVPGMFSWNPTSTVLTFDPSTYLLANTWYGIGVGEFGPNTRDAAGRTLAAPWRSSFSTDNAGPKVVAVEPPQNANVSIDTNVSVTFDTPVDRNSAQRAFTMLSPTTYSAVPGTFSWDATSTVMTFNPTSKLAGAAAYQVSVSPEATDMAGMSMPDYVTSSFNTVGTAPSIIRVDPGYGPEIPVDRNVVVTFSEPMDRLSVEAGFSVTGMESRKVAGTFSWDALSTVMTFDPSTELASNTWHVVGLIADVLDAAGDAIVGPWNSYFVTGDGGPTVGAEPAPGATGVPVDRNVVVTFSEPVERNSAQIAFALRRTGTTVNVIGTFAWNTASTVLTFNPSANLGDASNYTVTVAASVKDVAGNPMANPYTSTFTTSGQAPSVGAVDPPAGSIGVAVDRNVVMTFSEPMERGSAQAAFSLRKAGTAVNLGGAFTWDTASTVMTFNPFANLQVNSGYTVTVSVAAKDAGGNPMAGTFALEFISDAQGPTVLVVDPTAGATEVPVDRNVVVTFSEPVERNSAQTGFSLRKVGTTLNLGGAFTWDAASTVMTFNPYANLLANTGYTVAVVASVRDVGGNPMAAAFGSSFTSDAQGPTVAVEAAAGATDVPVDRNVVVTFSEPVERNSAQIAFSLRPTGTTVNLGGAFTWDVAARIMTFNPFANLGEASSYTVAVAATVKDVAGNPMAGPYGSSFTTGGRAPAVGAVDPPAAAAGVAVDRNVVVTFSEPMERGSAQAAFSLRRAGTTVNLGGAFTWDPASTVMTFNPFANLLANTGYSVAVAASAKDTAGNPMATAFASEFTSDAQGPTVIVDALSGATGVPVDRNVVVTFSEPVERNSAQAAFSLRKTGTTVNLGGAFTWDPASRMMTFNPPANLGEAASYTVAVAPTVKDVAGNPMAGPYSSSFTTSGQAPSVGIVDPAAAATGVAVDRNVVVTFSEAMERGSTQAAFSLRKAGTTVNLGGSFTWDPASTVMTFNPYANLLANSGYGVAVAASAKDTAGNPMASPAEWSFQTL